MFLYEKFMNVEPGSYTERDDIIANLNHVLSTKRECGSFLRGFGLTETGHATRTEMINELTLEITENILLYEPRVELLEIEAVFDEITKRTYLDVHLVIHSDNKPLRFSLDPRLKELQLHPEKTSDDQRG